MSRRKTYLCRLHFCEQRSREITFSARCTFFILFSSKFIHEALASALPTLFPPFDSLSISLGECCIPRRKKIKQFQASGVLHALLALGSLQKMHKTDHTTDSPLAIIFISLPVDQEWVLFLSGESTTSTHTKKGSNTMYVFFEIVTNDKKQ